MNIRTKKITVLLLGVLGALITLEIGVRLVGFIFLSYQEIKNREAMCKRGAYRILCLGDSMTAIGGRTSYPSQLEELLNQARLGIPVTVVNKGSAGANSAALLDTLEENLRMYHPAMVITMIGINDYTLRYYDDVTIEHPFLFEKCKLYKFLKLLWKEISNKSREGVVRKDRKNRIPEVQAWDKELSLSASERSGAVGEAERKVWKILKSNPRDDNAYVKLSLIYARDYRQYSQAEYFLRKAFDINPANDMAYVSLGYLHYQQGKFSDAEESAKKAIEMNAKNDSAYVVLGLLRRDEGNRTLAEYYFRKAIAINEKDDVAFAALGWLYKDDGKLLNAEESLKKAIQLNPCNDFARFFLAQVYLSAGRVKEAEDELKLALKINPYNDMAHRWLGEIYQGRQAFILAETCFRKAIEVNPKNNLVYWRLAVLYEETGKFRLAKEYRKKASELYCTPIMRRNYLQIKAILDRYNVKLVCAQYPLRSIEPLKEILADAHGIVFVENDKNFKEALRGSNPKEYFVDLFAGDFGHCTPRGHRLIAENIAQSILKEVFHKEKTR